MSSIKPPSSLSPPGKSAFRRLAKQMRAQGLDPRSRLDELGDFGALVDEQAGLLEAAKVNRDLDVRVRLSRQLTTIIGQKSKLFSAIMRPVAGQQRLSKKQIAAARGAAANTGRLATPAPPRRLLPGLPAAGERDDVLSRYLGAGQVEDGA